MQAVRWAKVGTFNIWGGRGPVSTADRKIHRMLKGRLQVRMPSRRHMKFLDCSTHSLAVLFSKYRINDKPFEKRAILVKCLRNQRGAHQANMVDAKNSGFVRQCENCDKG